MNTFRFGQSRNAHVAGDAECKGCRWDTPQPCPECGEGLVHIEFNDRKDGPVLVFHCDVCVGKGREWNKV